MSIQILVIEDVVQIRENIAELLTLNGYEVRMAEDGAIGIVEAKQWQPDLILCDIMMANLDGYQVLETIRTSPDLAHIPFIFLTAKADMVDLRQGMGLGADDYLTKPFLISDLLNAIDSRLKRSKQQRIDLVPSTTHLRMIRGRDEKGYMLLKTEECVSFFTQKRGYFVWHPRGTFQLDISLDTLVTKLDQKQFFRVNRHTILHRKSVQKYAYWDKGKYCLSVDIGGEPQEVTLAKARFRSFKEWLSI
ncbi:response regulator [Spirosoma endophyticum]|uniref:Two component transcriptional regulator, LytTR family n=1 Tax=Spirosoma endophyticum TaxID=662367 RepID=A0A1I2AJX9_9BACT|nr:response regulator [Spirosoma endophyticum]SFE44324.1 two component transcriptional regulator, LytTR family [Spirosoma endophyticum]